MAFAHRLCKSKISRRRDVQKSNGNSARGRELDQERERRKRSRRQH